MRSLHAPAPLLALALAAAGCDPAEIPMPKGPPPKPAATAPLPPPPPTEPADPLGPRPSVDLPAPFAPPVPTVYTRPNGTTVWLVERHALPVVAVDVAVPYGSASDPKGREGLAFITAGMLDEGAGTRGALDLARAVDMLGATLRTGTHADWSYASLSVLKRNFSAAIDLLGDVVVRPRFDAAEYKRVQDLWVNELKQRASDADDVSGVVTGMTLYGEGHGYAHPADGLVAPAQKLTLDDVKKSYAARWRPDAATVVVVGDVTRAELDPLLDKALGAWKAPPTPALEVPKPGAPRGVKASTDGALGRVVLVDRADAPQAVIAVARAGVAASDADAPRLTRANIALGGSFTSRLNQDLREERGWSYGARSRLTLTRGTGPVVASAAVQVDKTGDALKAMLDDIEKFATGGLTEEEAVKTRLQARSELVQLFESVDGAALRLARDAALGLPPDYEAKSSLRRDAASKDELNQLVRVHFDVKDAVVVVVGPRAKIEPQLGKLGVKAFDVRDAEGAAAKR
jgi:predicted Zn-dependent peptidase